MVSAYKKRAKQGYNNDKDQSNKDERSLDKKEIEQNLQENLSENNDLNKRKLKREKKRTKRMVEEKLLFARKKLEHFKKRFLEIGSSSKSMYQSIIHYYEKDVEKLEQELDKFNKV